MKLQRYENNPILTPNPHNLWEARCVYNPAVIYDNGLFYMVYRGMGVDNISRLGLAVSLDGFEFFRFDKPVFSPTTLLEARGCEDPRMVKFGDKYYMTYTAYSDKGTRIGIATTTNFLNWERLEVDWDDENNKDAVLFPEKINGKYVLLHRPMTEKRMGVWIAYSDDLIHWTGHKEIMSPNNDWEGQKLGANTPPIKTEKGWLLIYHGTDEQGVYRLGVAFLDLHNPSKLIYQHPYPILEPTEDYELRGEIPRVVFAGGICEVQDKYYIYYGAADRVIGVAIAEKEEILNLVN
ncbi:MAG: glycosidase [Candidatus Stahlbacteria bacterium]|nr:glycosidase [Candidatus Stahlbacteria bacterium]